MSKVVQLKVRVPHEVKSWLLTQANINRSSQSSEVVRAIRERMCMHSNAKADRSHDARVDTISNPVEGING